MKSYARGIEDPLSTLEDSLSETQAPGLAKAASLLKGRKALKSAVLVTALLMLGLMIDYGGGFGIKNLVGLLALTWALLRPYSFEVYYRHRLSLFLFLGLPALLGVLHLLLVLMSIEPGASSGLVTFAVELYQRVSPAILLMLLPLFYAAGTKAVIRQITTGFRILSVVLIVIFALHSLGIINLENYWYFAQTRQIGFVGLDPRLQGVATSQRPVLSPRIAFVIPLALAFELASSLPAALLLLLSILVVSSRGLLIGAALLILLWIGTALRKRRGIAILLRLTPLVAVFALILLSSSAIRYRLSDVLLARLGQSVQGTDQSTRVRVGHLEGYLDLVEERPWVVVIGVGPLGFFTNTTTGYQEHITEMSILNLALWFGLPYTLLYTLALYLAAWRVWRFRRRPAFEKRDMALVIGATVFWLVGNFNPMMVSPFGTIAYMLLLVRCAELRAAEQLHRQTGGSRVELKEATVAP